MFRDQQSGTRRLFLLRLTVSLTLTAAAGCGSERGDTGEPNKRPGKFKALNEQSAGSSRRQTPGPNELRPADGDR